MLEDGRYTSVSDIARAEKIDRRYVGSILLLTLLAPDIVEAIMDGRQPAELGVHMLRIRFLVEWGSSVLRYNTVGHPNSRRHGLSW